MSWHREPSTLITGDDFAWISNFLKSYDGDLLEFELDVDCQHFFDNMDVVLAQEPPNDHRQCPLRLTPFVLNVISDLQDSASIEKDEAIPAPSISFCELLKEAQSAVKSERKVRHATTATRHSRRLKRQRKTATAASSASNEKRTTRSSSRRIINRRLFQ
ncbi:hypothetical protein V7S43_009752 [Phytophthora oleae]|uniref:DDE-1 domain-containing protein n=1 Tax=Phytophthora oleae TaxID=2107226 RepID=A0ABD3FGY8_9STRA